MPNTSFFTTVRYTKEGIFYAVGDACVGLASATKTLDTTKPEAAKFIFPALAVRMAAIRPLMKL